MPDPSSSEATLVIGLGEVGGPLLEILREAHRADGRDIEDRPFERSPGPSSLLPVYLRFRFVGVPLRLAL